MPCPDGPSVGSYVLIFDGTGQTTILGHGDLGYGNAEAYKCDYTWSIDGIPDNRRSYTVSIDGRTGRVDGDIVRRQERVQLPWEAMTPAG